MTSQEINEAVARGLGYIKVVSGWMQPTEKYNGIIDTVPDYCHDIQAAWEIVENLIHSVGNDGDYYQVALSTHKNETLCVINELSDKRIEARADTAPMAICLTYLKSNDPKI